MVEKEGRSVTQIFWGKGDIHERFGNSRAAPGVSPCSSRAGQEGSQEICSHPALLQLHPGWKVWTRSSAPSSLKAKGCRVIRSPLSGDCTAVRRRQRCSLPQGQLPAPVPAVALPWMVPLHGFPFLGRDQSSRAAV